MLYSGDEPLLPTSFADAVAPVFWVGFLVLLVQGLLLYPAIMYRRARDTSIPGLGLISFIPGINVLYALILFFIPSNLTASDQKQSVKRPLSIKYMLFGTGMQPEKPFESSEKHH
jgi:hypothetical protein